MSARWAVFSAIGLASLTLLGCQQKATSPEIQSTSGRETIKAYAAYGRGECDLVAMMSDPDRLATWAATEPHYAMVLVRAFCSEIAGDLDAARDDYRAIVAEGPDSFAAQDAQERLRILDRLSKEPEYAAWIQDAPERVDPSAATRTPIDRVPATYPPIVRAAGIAGHAVVEFGVSPLGSTQEPIIVESDPPFLFDGSSLRAVRQWQFMRDRQADADARQVIRIVFETVDGGPASAEGENSEQAQQ